MRIKPPWKSPKQKEAHYEEVARFLEWLRLHNNVMLVKYADNGDVIKDLSHKEIEKLMSQYCGVNLTIVTPMSERE